MVATASSLVRELAQRMGEFYLSTPTGGTTTTLIDAALDQYWPSNVGQQSAPMGIWGYGSITADTNNRGIERRAKSYQQSTHTVTFLSAWPTTISTGAYELHWRTPRSRKLEAINSGVRQLGFHWARTIVDGTTLTTAANTWSYALPTNIQWGSIPLVELQIALDATLIGYPYVNAGLWNWTVRPATDSSGATTYTLQFGTLPPPNRKIRVFADANYSDLVADADILPMDVMTSGIATEWLYSWAMYQLQRWESVRQPMNNTQWLEQQAAALMKEASEIRDRFAGSPPMTKITTPGKGDGEWPSGMASDPQWFAAYQTIH